MNKAPKTSSIGVVGGVLSALGLCVGIVSLGKKHGTEVQARPARSTALRCEPVPPALEVNEEGGPEIVDLFHDADTDRRLPSEKSAGEQPSESGPELRTGPDIIADLANRGESTLAIAQALGISTGEVQLTLKLQQLSASAGRKH